VADSRYRPTPAKPRNLSTYENWENSVKYWEIIADNLKEAGWNLGWVSALDLEGRTIWIVDAHGYGKHFIVRVDEILTAFLEMERAIHQFAMSLISSSLRRSERAPGPAPHYTKV
jgi:hypothetical protein